MDQIALSTMMAEYYALSMAMREALPFKGLVNEVAKALYVSDTALVEFQVTIWEDNNGALTLANLDPGQMTPRSKFYDSKVHWFRSHLGPRMKVVKVDTEAQLADMFTTPLGKEVFQRVRKLIMGW